VPFSSEVTMCPYLVPVVADRMFVYPQSVYCRRPDAGVRVPGRSTLLSVCMTAAFCECAGYRDSAATERISRRTP
jgi:hypothetical protein